MIALVGYGYWGKNLARVFKDKLKFIIDKDDDNLNKAKYTYGKDVNYDRSLTNVLKTDKSIQAVLIATKPESHLDIAKLCLKYNKHIWIEKPICATYEEALELQEYHNKVNNRLRVMVDHTFLFHPAIQKLSSINIGEPLYYDSHRISLGLFQKDVDAILDLAIHDLSILDYLYPDLVLDKRSIIKNNHINDKANQSILNLKFTNNFTATINVNWVSPVKKREIILAGSNSSIIFDDISVEKVKVYDTGELGDDYNINSVKGYTNIEIPDMIEPLAQGYEEFKNSVKENRQPLTSLERSLKIQSWVDQW